MDVQSQHQLSARLITGLPGETALAALLNQSFPVLKGGQFFDDFPVWSEKLGPSGKIQRFGIFNGSDLIACAGLRVAELNALTPVNVGLIGAVATHPHYRNQGLASKMVEITLKRAEQLNLAALFLWGSEHALYERYGFQLCGSQVRVALGELNLPEASQIQVAQGWNRALLPMLLSRPLGVRLNADDARWIEAHKNVQWFWSGPKEKPNAYIAIGKGMDLQGMIHEWGGDTESLRKLLAFVKSHNPALQLLGAPALFTRNGFEFPPEQIEFLCMAKILDPEKLFKAHFPRIDFSAKKEEGGWSVSMPDSPAGKISVEDAPAFFFGPGLPGSSLQIPLWFWGLDGA